MSIFRQEIIERYKFPRHKRQMQDADAQGEVINRLCGDELTLYIRLTKPKDAIEHISFQGEGCALMTAAADLLCECMTRKPLHEADAFTSEDMIALYGEMPSPSRLKCVLLPFEALKRGLAGLR